MCIFTNTKRTEKGKIGPKIIKYLIKKITRKRQQNKTVGVQEKYN